MITVNIKVNGDVAFHCSGCEFEEVIPITLSDSPFWDVYNGSALLMMLNHYREAHN